MPTPYVGEIFTFQNPDGSEVTLHGWGNQFTAVFETEDGYTAVQAPDGYYEYAKPTEDGTKLEPSGTRIGDVDPAELALPQHVRLTPQVTHAQVEQAQAELGPIPRWMERRQDVQAQQIAGIALEGPEAAPPSGKTTGDYLGLVLLIDFSDFPQTISRQEVDDFCNKPGYSGFGNNGSAFDYFRDVSDGKLRYKNRVAAYYRAKHPRTYYTDPKISYGTRTQELIKEALDHLVANRFDFSGLSADSSGYIRALSVFYAGTRSNDWSEGLWPHAWRLATSYSIGNGRKFGDYQITDLGTQLTLRTFCHENGHMVCDFPDLYDYDRAENEKGNGVGHYSLMCAGGPDRNPVQVDAYLKHAAGWASKVTTLGSGVTATVEAGKNDFLLHAKNAAEYFIIENRQKSGRDAALPDEGVAIWHVDVKGNNSHEQMTPAKHYELSLEQADNRFDLERRVNNGDADDLYGGAKGTFGTNTAPSSKWWDGSVSGLEIESISAVAKTMTIKTRPKGPQLYSNMTVSLVFTTNEGQNGWVNLAGRGWRKIQTGNANGVTNMLGVFAMAKAKGRPVSVLADETTAYQAYL